MPWEEFVMYLSRISSDTALGRIVQIRVETDSEVMENWPPELKSINRSWQRRREEKIANSRTEEEERNFYKMLDSLFV